MSVIRGDTCIINKYTWLYKIIGLFVLIVFLSVFTYVYYKSLNNIKHKESSSL